MRRWEISSVREEQSAAIRDLAKALGVGELTGALLLSRGFSDVEGARAFLAKETEAFYDPFLMKDMDKAVAAVRKAVDGGKKIVIYGDYDVDGVTATSALYLYLKGMGAQVDYYIPSRSEEGYGINMEALDALAEKGFDLMITVDTGITAKEEIEYARSLGIETVVTDHHTCHTELPEALAVVNPHRPDCSYPFKELAGVGVVFKLICAIEKQIREENGQTDAGYLRHVCELCADLVAIGTVADVMPLTEENRLIVSIGLAMIEKTERAGLSALIDESTQLKRRTVNASFIGFTIAPRINAAGRLGHAGRAVELFLCEDEETARMIARELCDTNKERQQEENSILAEALEKIGKEVTEEDEVIVLASDGWHPGVIGIVASRITEKYGKPAILISFDGEVGKGSGRSVKGINLVNALSACESLLLKFGGHELAAGLSIERDKLDDFRQGLNAYVKENKNFDFVDELHIDCTCDIREVTVKNADEVACMEPYGTANPEPLFALFGAKIAEIKAIGGGKHTRFVFEKDGIRAEAVWFGCNLMQTNFYAMDTVDVAFRLQINDFMNVKSAQMLITDLRLCGDSHSYLKDGREQYEGSKGEHRIADEEQIIPEREDFAAVYRYIRSEVRKDNDVIGAKGIARRVDSVSYAKARYIIDIFREVNLVGIEPYGPEPDIYKFKLKPETGKVNLERSAIYKRLKSRKEYK